jgi:hypothetical protein
MTTTTQTRLDAYLAAELAILQAQVNRENAAVAGNGGLGYSLANLSGES